MPNCIYEKVSFQTIENLKMLYATTKKELEICKKENNNYKKENEALRNLIAEKKIIFKSNEEKHEPKKLTYEDYRKKLEHYIIENNHYKMENEKMRNYIFDKEYNMNLLKQSKNKLEKKVKSLKNRNLIIEDIIKEKDDTIGHLIFVIKAYKEEINKLNLQFNVDIDNKEQVNNKEKRILNNTLKKEDNKKTILKNMSEIQKELITELKEMNYKTNE